MTQFVKATEFEAKCLALLDEVARTGEGLVTAIAHNATLMTADAALLRWTYAISRHDAAT
jgi:hypothetical protein